MLRRCWLWVMIWWHALKPAPRLSQPIRAIPVLLPFELTRPDHPDFSPTSARDYFETMSLPAGRYEILGIEHPRFGAMVDGVAARLKLRGVSHAVADRERGCIILKQASGDLLERYVRLVRFHHPR